MPDSIDRAATLSEEREQKCAQALLTEGHTEEAALRFGNRTTPGEDLTISGRNPSHSRPNL